MLFAAIGEADVDAQLPGAGHEHHDVIVAALAEHIAADLTAEIAAAR